MDNPARGAIVATMRYDHDIAIIGGGLNGPALALALAQTGFRVAVIDRPATGGADFDGRAYALALASVRLLEAVGVWQAVAENAQPMLEIKVTDGRAGQGASPWMLHFDHAEIEEGPMGHMVEDRHLRAAFADAMGRDGRITQIAGEVTAQTTDVQGATVTLSSGDTLTARLIIGCDGRASGTAGRAGIRRTGWGYGQTAVVCAVGHDRPHDGVAHQFFMPTGPLAILPLTGNRSSIVWSTSDARAAAMLAQDDAGFLDALRPAFGSFLGEIALRGPRSGYPLGLTLAQQFVAQRVALVGDAAHGIHPIAGQGLNAGLRDVAALVQVLGTARGRGEDWAGAQVLTRYQDWRQPETRTLAMSTDAFNRLFSNDNAVLRLARDLGMGAINAMPGLRRGLIREAAGLGGEMPDLMRS